MAVTITAQLVSTYTPDPERPPHHNGWNNPYGDPEWIADIDWYRRVQLIAEGPEVGSVVNWECYDDTVVFMETAEIEALTDPSNGVFINNTETWTVWAWGGVSYTDTKTACISTLRANGPRVQVLLGPPRKVDPDDYEPPKWKIAAFLPGSGRTPAAQTDVGGPPAEPESVTVTPSTASVAVGATTQLTAVVDPPEVPQSVTWQSGTPAIATVSGAGLVTGVAAGTAAIQAWAVGNSVYGSCSVTVTAAGPPPVTSVDVAPDAPSIAVGATVQLAATMQPPDANQTPDSWSSATPAVATVDASGLVTGVTAGTSQVAALANGGTMQGFTVVTVTAVGALAEEDKPRRKRGK